jgi:hypothetical protein
MLGANGVRPRVAWQLIREFTYLYRAVSPKDGACGYLIMPAADAECFQILLDALAKRFARWYILLFVDGAGNQSTCRKPRNNRRILSGSIDMLKAECR